MSLFKVSYRIVFLLLLSFSSLKSYSQTITLAPNGIKQCLLDNYPTLLDSEEKLDTVKTKSITTTLNCPNKGIVNAEDLRYFTGVRDLKLNNNDIVDLTPIARLSQLVTIDISSNELEFVPDLSSFLSLSEFSANYNQMDDFPVLPNNIKIIRVGNNSLAGTIDVTGKSQLSVFEAFENDIREIKGLETTYLTYADFHTNELNIPTDLSGIQVLEHFDIRDNEYQDLPQLNTENLNYLAVADNFLTFQDLLPYATLPTNNFPNYYQQAKPEKKSTVSVELGKTWTWTLSFDQTVTSNIYHWFKNGEEIKATTEGVFEIQTISLSDSGIYHCEVENTTSGLTGGKLVTNELTLKIVPKSSVDCFTINDLTVSIDAPACQEIANVVINSDITGQTGAVSYVVNGIISTTGQFQLTIEGSFPILIKDQACHQTANKEVEVFFDSTDCDPASFSPNGDGLDDGFYINENGRAAVYNKRGVLVKQLQVPAYWDGTNDQGQLQDFGLYIIMINEKDKISVTLIR